MEEHERLKKIGNQLKANVTSTIILLKHYAENNVLVRVQKNMC